MNKRRVILAAIVTAAIVQAYRLGYVSAEFDQVVAEIDRFRDDLYRQVERRKLEGEHAAPFSLQDRADRIANGVAIVATILVAVVIFLAVAGAVK